jgi:hypothetical protein
MSTPTVTAVALFFREKTLFPEDFNFFEDATGGAIEDATGGAIEDASSGATDGDLSFGPFLRFPRIKESRRSVEDISLFLAKLVLQQKDVRRYQKIQLTGLKGDIRKRNNLSAF